MKTGGSNLIGLLIKAMCVKAIYNLKCVRINNKHVTALLKVKTEKYAWGQSCSGDLVL